MNLKRWKNATHRGGRGLRIGRAAVTMLLALIGCVASTTMYSMAEVGGGSGGTGATQGAYGVKHFVIWSDGGTVNANGDFTPYGATGEASVQEWLRKWEATEGYTFNGTEEDGYGGKHINAYYTAARTAIERAKQRTGLGAEHIRIVGMGWWSCALTPRGRGFTAYKTPAQCLDREGTAGELPNTTSDGTPLWDAAGRTNAKNQAIADSSPSCSIVVVAVADSEYPSTVPVLFQKQGDPTTVSTENDWGDKGEKVPASQMGKYYSYEGAVYGLYRDEACTQWIEDITIGPNGSTTAQELRRTALWLKEKKAPKGWALSGDVVPFNTGAGTTVKLNEQPNYGELTIRKLDGTNKKKVIPQNGFTFKLTNNATNESWTQTSIKGGIVTFSHLAFGEYTVVETAAPSPYLVNSTPYKVTISEDNLDKTEIGVQIKQENLDITDSAPSTPPTTLRKTDTADGSVLDGATYELYAVSDVVLPSGKLYDAGKTIKSYTTDSNGQFTIPTGVMYPDKDGNFNYALREVAAPEGHLINTGKVIKLTGKYVNDKTPLIQVAPNNKVSDTDLANDLILTKSVLTKDGDSNDDKTVEGGDVPYLEQVRRAAAQPELGQGILRPTRRQGRHLAQGRYLSADRLRRGRPCERKGLRSRPHRQERQHARAEERREIRHEARGGRIHRQAQDGLRQEGRRGVHRRHENHRQERRPCRIQCVRRRDERKAVRLRQDVRNRRAEGDRHDDERSVGLLRLRT